MPLTTAARVTAIPLPAPVPCDGALLAVPAGRYDWIRLLVGVDDRAAQHRTGDLDEEVWLHYRDGVDPEWLRSTGADVDGLRSARIPVPRRDELLAVRLPDRPGLTLHAVDCMGRYPTEPAIAEPAIAEPANGA